MTDIDVPTLDDLIPIIMADIPAGVVAVRVVPASGKAVAHRLLVRNVSTTLDAEPDDTYYVKAIAGCGSAEYAVTVG
jgi:hypothetical protein